MNKALTRKQFIRLAALTGAGLLLSACGTEDKPVTGKKEPADAAKDPSLPDQLPASEHVTFYRKGDAAYDQLRPGFNKRIEQYPAVIALCHDTQGVAEAVAYARQNRLPVAIKSGGHCFEGFSSNNDGLVINLSGMNQVQWLDKGLVKVGPGCTLSGLYDALLPQGRIIPAGSCGSVGLGGLTLGGGYGLFGRQYGLTCDSLVEVTLVDGTGKVRSSKDDADLLWACKGGGNGNFGVVTELVFQTHDAPAMIQSHRFKAYKLDAARATSILETWFGAVAKLPVSCFSAFVLNGKSLTILITNHGTHTDDVQQVMDALSAVTDKATIGEPKALAGALTNYYGIQHPIYFKNASAGFYKSYDDIKGCITQVCDMVTSTPGMIYQVNTLGGNIASDDFEKASAYAHRAYPFLSELQTYWDQPPQSEKLLGAFRQVQDLFAANGIATQYRNYPDIQFKDWPGLYYGDRYKKLQEIKNTYDPDNIVRHAQSVVPAGQGI